MMTMLQTRRQWKPAEERNHGREEGGKRKSRLRGASTSTSTSTSVSTPSTSRFSVRFSFLGGRDITG